MESPIKIIQKTESEKYPVDMDLVDVLNGLALSSVTFDNDTGINITDLSFKTDSVVRFYISGGTEGNDYNLKILPTTSDGLQEIVYLTIQVVKYKSGYKKEYRASVGSKVVIGIHIDTGDTHQNAQIKSFSHNLIHFATNTDKSTAIVSSGLKSNTEHPQIISAEIDTTNLDIGLYLLSVEVIIDNQAGDGIQVTRVFQASLVVMP